MAHGFSSFTYVWKNSYGKISPDTRRIVTRRLELIEIAGQLLYISELKITNVEESDEGFYYCSATNDCGNDTTEAWLEVDSKMHIECYLAMYIFNKYRISEIIRQRKYSLISQILVHSQKLSCIISFQKEIIYNITKKN